MSIVSEIRLKVVRRVNLGNYEHVEIEGMATVGRDSDDDTPEKLRNDAPDQVAELLKAAEAEHLPKRRRGRDEDYR